MVSGRSITIGVGLAPHPGSPAIPVSTLTDNFDDNTLDTTKWTVGQIVSSGWTTTGCTVAETNQRLEVTVAANATNKGDGYVSIATYSLSGDAVFVKVPNIASLQTGEVVRLTFGAGFNATVVVFNGNVLAGEANGAPGGSTSFGTDDVWFRLRHDAPTDTLKIDTAPATASDPPATGDWVNRVSWTRDPTTVLSGQVAFSVDANGTGPATPTVVQFDGFNTATTTLTSVALTGQSLLVAQGTVLQGAPLTGQSLSVAQGSAAVATSVALTGQALTAAQGTVAATTALALSGQTVAIGQGSVLQGAPITGQNTTVAIGSVAPTVSIALTGQTLTGATGTVSPVSSLALSGQALTVARGSVVAAPSLALTGQGASVAQGSVPASLSLALTGGALTVGQGSVTASAPGSAALSGQSVVTARGTASPGTSIALAGQSLAAAQSVLVPATSLGIAGQQTTSAQGTVVPASNDVTVALTGVAAFLAQGAVTPQFIAALVGSGLTVTPGSITGGLHLEYPLADVPQHRPNEAATQHRPLENIRQRYPLEAV